MGRSLFNPKWWTVVYVFLFICTIPASAQMLLDPKTQPQFINPLPIPSVIDGRNGGQFNVTISQFNQWLGLINTTTQQPINTTVWGYNGTYPGPTILAKKNEPLSFFWLNNLVDGNNNPLPHLLPVDESVHWAFDDITNWQQYGVPIVTHLHGGHTESASDDLPDAWYTPSFSLKGHGFIKGDALPYYYTNDQEAATIWYHDHALGITRLNVYAGLAGYYLITDQNEMSLQQSHNLPAPPYDLGLAIQDKMFKANGQLFYPSSQEEDDDDSESMDHSILPEFFGDFILVNGMTWPMLEVEPRQYRFRVLNGSDSRFYNLHLSNGHQIMQIGTDNGFLASPLIVHQMLLGPGERKDVIIDFSTLAGQTIIMQNNAKTPFPKGESVDPQTTGRIMAFKVTKPLDATYPLTSLPATLRPAIQPLTTTLPSRKLILFEGTDELGRLKPMLGTVEHGGKGWHEPISENPVLNSTEIWEIYNETVDAHPIHLHMVTMQLVNRQRFKADIDAVTGKPENIDLLGQPKSPTAEEKGWKDTWVMYPGEVTRVIAKFDIEGLYVWHCHILSHEDHEMMRPYYVGELNNNNIHMMERRPVITSEEVKLQSSLWPNPSNGNFSIQLYLYNPSRVVFVIYDSQGRLVGKTDKGTLQSGWHQLPVNINDLANGNYYCEIRINNYRQVEQIVIQK